jgi:hypothetical protein
VNRYQLKSEPLKRLKSESDVVKFPKKGHHGSIAQTVHSRTGQGFATRILSGNDEPG